MRYRDVKIYLQSNKKKFYIYKKKYYYWFTIQRVKIIKKTRRNEKKRKKKTTINIDNWNENLQSSKEKIIKTKKSNLEFLFLDWFIYSNKFYKDIYFLF